MLMQELTGILPQTLSAGGAAACAGIALAGTALWLLGAAWARPIATLCAVAAGGIAGIILPRCMGWPINTMATAVVGAIVLGLTGWLGHRLWVGLILGVVLSAWAALGTWIVLRGDYAWEWMNIPNGMIDYDMLGAARAMWEHVEEPVRGALPYAAATAMVAALSMTLLFRRIGSVLSFSIAGMTLLVLAMLTLLANRQPGWLQVMPVQPAAEIGILTGAVLLGALIQWQLLPTARENELLKQQAADPTRRYE